MIRNISGTYSCDNAKCGRYSVVIRTVQDMQVGQSRRQAYDSLGRRSEVPDLRRFVRAIVEADKYCVAIADVLRTAVPVLPRSGMLFILLVLFIVLLGPTVLEMVKSSAERPQTARKPAPAGLVTAP